MTEKIIIDGVDVAGCINFVGCNMCNDFLDGQCEGHNCEYKQLKRLEFELKITKADYEASEQENKELKEKNENIINEYNRIQNEIIGDMEFKEIMLTGITPLKVLQNLKERNRELQAFYDVHESFKTDFDTNRKLLDNYRSALEEIRILATKNVSFENFVKIQDKINEVLQ